MELTANSYYFFLNIYYYFDHIAKGFFGQGSDLFNR